jgi:hypothetical protein
MLDPYDGCDGTVRLVWATPEAEILIKLIAPGYQAQIIKKMSK